VYYAITLTFPLEDDERGRVYTVGIAHSQGAAAKRARAFQRELPQTSLGVELRGWQGVKLV